MIFREIGLTLVFAAILVLILFKIEFSFLETNARGNADTVHTREVSSENLNKKIRIAVGIGALESLARDLVENTNVEIVPAFNESVPIRNQKTLINAKKFNPDLDAGSVTACINIRSASQYSKLYSYLRGENINIVEIDCACPVESSRRSVSLVQNSVKSPGGGSFYSNIWLSPENALRIVDLLAEDICRLAPEWAEQILENQVKIKKEIIDIMVKHLEAFSNYDNIDVVALSNDFFYLTSSFQIFVADYFQDDGRKWGEDKLAALKKSLIENDVKVVIHKWQPDESVLKTIYSTGAQLVVLDPVDETILNKVSYIDKLSENLKILDQVFKNAFE